MQLLLQATWLPTVPDTLLATQQQVFSLIDLFDECPAEELPLSCFYDFTQTDGGWLPVINTFTAPDSCIPVGTDYPSAEYVPGVGWKAFYDCTNSLLFLYLDITGMTINRVVVTGRSDESRSLRVTVNTTTEVMSVATLPPDFTAVADGEWSGIHMEVDMGEAFDADVNTYITGIYLQGVGTGCPGGGP